MQKNLKKIFQREEPSQAEQLAILWKKIENKMGICPSFFKMAAAEPSIARGLFDIAKFAYLDSALPASFKEKLFTYLSRFCETRYCVTRHAAFLLGKGYIAGDATSPSLSPKEVADLVSEPLPESDELPALLAEIQSHEPLKDWPDYESHAGKLTRIACAMTFIRPERSDSWTAGLRHLYGASRYEQLMLFLAFIRTAHFWTEVHPELELEEDISLLLAEHQFLAQPLLENKDEKNTILQSKITHELGELRKIASLTEELQISRDRFRAAIDAVNGILWTNNAAGQMIGEQPGWEALTGQTQTEYEGHGWLKAVHPDDAEATLKEWDNAVAEQKLFVFEHRVRRHDGEWRHFSIRAIPIFEATGIREWVGVHTDITEQKQAALSLSKHWAQLDAVYQAMNDGVVVFNMDGEAVLVNESQAKLCGYENADEMKRDFAYFSQTYEVLEIDGKPVPIDQWPVKRVLRGESIANLELRVRRKDIDKEWIIAFNGEPVKDSTGNQLLAVIISRDVTADKHAQTMLEAQKQSLEMVLSNAPLKEVLTFLTNVVEKQSEGAVVPAILLVDDEGRLRNGAAPSLPDSYNKAIDGLKSAVDLGTCSKAVITGKTVITEDIDAAPDWQTIKHLPLSIGLKAAWSQPFFSRKGKVLGTFGTYFKECRGPSEQEKQVVEMLSSMAAIAIEHSQDETALRESEERFRSIAKATSDAIWDWDMRTNEVWWNEGITTVFGHPREAVGSHADWWMEHIHPDDREYAVADIRKVIDDAEQFWEHEYRYKRGNGSYSIVLDRGYTIQDETGKTIRMVGGMQDITQSKADEQKLKASESFNRGLMDASADCLKILDKEGRLLHMNATGLCLMELDDFSPLCGTKWADFWPEETKQEISKSLEAATKGELYRFEAFCPTAKGTPKWWDIQVTPIMNENDEVIRLLSVSRDITDKKQSEKALIEAREKAEAANIAKSEFLANMSHEIRTPMNAIVGLADLLMRNKQLPSNVQEMVSTLKLSSQSMMALVNDVLDIAKIETNKIDLEHIAFSFFALVDEVQSMMGQKAREKGLQFKIEGGDCISEYYGDPTRIRQILLNLVGNAVKFTEKGSILVRCDTSPHEDPNHQYVHIHVVDTGIGIAENKLESIFEKFSQADSTTTRQYGGTGLGLAISKNLAEIMGGGITVKSTKGKGTTFTLHLPLQIAEKRAHSITPESHNVNDENINTTASQRPCVLLVEDYPANVLVASLVLDSLGYDYELAENGNKALEKLRSNREKYFAVLMDVQMPEMDGLEATRIIRKQEAKEGLQPMHIIAMTAFAMKEDYERCLSAGMDNYISKPFDHDELGRMLKELEVTETV